MENENLNALNDSTAALNGNGGENQKAKNYAFRRILSKIKSYLGKPENLILIIFLVLLCLTVAYPLVRLIMSSFTVQSAREAKTLNEAYNLGVKKGSLTWALWPMLLFTPDISGGSAYSLTNFWTPLYKSALMAGVACVIAVLFGGLLAWLITRSNMPCKKYISTIFVFPYIMPSWSIAMFWENFFKNTEIAACNYQMGMLQAMTGICVPEDLLYGFWPSAFVLGLHYIPFAYILIGGILRNMDANLEEAAVILKASRWKILTRITLPIVAPAMISTILLVFSSSISSYSVPAFLNKGGTFTAISIVMRGALNDTSRKGSGYVIAVILLVFSVLILSLNNWFTRSRRSYTTVSGKSGQVTKTNLGKYGKWIVAVIAIIVVTFFTVFPLLTFVLESLEQSSGDLSSITLKYWISQTDLGDTRLEMQGQSTAGIFFNSTIWKAFGRSVLVSVIVAFIAGTFGILIGYGVSKKRKSKLANAVSSLAFLPYLIPALSFSAVFFSLSFLPTFSWMSATSGGDKAAVIACIIVGSVKFLPFASRTGTNAMLQLSGEIEESAIIFRVPWYKRMTRILFPIQKSSFMSGYLLPFISCMRELTLFVLLTGPFTLITNVLSYYQTYGLDQLSNAINLLIVVFVILANLIINKITGASIDKGIGG